SEFKDKKGDLIVKSKRIRQIDCLCGCADSISDEDKEFIFEKFYSKGSHELQNEYLRGCTEVAGVEILANEVKRRIFIHKLHFNSRTVQVCQKFFLAVHDIGRSRLRRKVLNRDLRLLKLHTPEKEDEIAQIYHKHEKHLEYADVFYRDMAAAKLFAEHHFALCLDYQQNIPVPVTRVNKEFYLRQLWIYNFGIKNLKSGQTTMFLYSENFSKKGANEIISCLLWYIENIVPDHVTTLSIFCDNPAGQNKNRFVYTALQYLVNTRFERLYVKYPIPGHSRMPIDADFGLIETKKRRLEHIYLPSDIVQLVKSSRNVAPFNVVYVNQPLTNDLCDDGTPIVIVKDYKLVFADLFRTSVAGGLDLNSIREMRFLANCPPIANFSDRFDLVSREITFLADNIDGRQITEHLTRAKIMYDDFLPVNLAKVINLKVLLPHIAMGPEVIFFDVVFAYEKDNYRRYVKGP
ncbi:unnamed protein product, partial [Allacma fusca]